MANVAADSNFLMIGVSHKKAPLKVREKFCLNPDSIKQFILSAKLQGFDSLLVLSTCNRSEIYANTIHQNELIRFFCWFTGNKITTFKKYGVVLKKSKVIRHLMEVAAGIDSQVLGDFQIAGQLKNAYQSSMGLGAVDASLSKLAQQAIVTSKKIKSQTSLSSGTSSVSSAAVHYLKKNVKNLESKKVLLFGLGKVGKLACKNLLKSVPKKNITIVNRSYENAQVIGNELGIKVGDYQSLAEELGKADIIIVATGAGKPTVTGDELNFSEFKNRVFVDLSMPRNVCGKVSKLKGVQVINLDQLEDICNDTFQKRKESLLAAHRIISEGIIEFQEWLDHRWFVRSLQSELHHSVFYNGEEEEINTAGSKFITGLSKKYFNLLRA